MTYDLAALARARRKGGLRKPLRLPQRHPTKTQGDDLARLFDPLVAHWEAEARRMVTKTETGRVYVTDSPEAAARDLSDAHARAAPLIASAETAIFAWLASMDRWHRDKWVRTVARRTGVEIDNMLGDMVSNASVRRLGEWIVALLRDVGAQMRRAIEALIYGPSDTTRSAARQIGATARRRARFIATDQTMNMVAALTEARHQEAGIGEYEWQHSFRRNPRRHHVERQGQTFQWSKPPRDGHPGVAPNCRCTALAVLPAG